MRRRRYPTFKFLLSLLIFSLFPLSLSAGPFVLLLSQDSFKKDPSSIDDPTILDSDSDDFDDETLTSKDELLDLGSWRPIFESDWNATKSTAEAIYYSGIGKMMSGNIRVMEDAKAEIEAAAESGFPAAQSVMGLFYGMGIMKERSKAKALLQHHFAAEGGDMQSKMVLAYMYSRQDVSVLIPLPCIVLSLLLLGKNTFLVSKPYIIF